MKRILTIVGILAAGLTLLGYAHAKRQRAATDLDSVQSERAEAEAAWNAADAEQTKLREKLLDRRPVFVSSRPANHFSPALSEWLAAGNFADVPPPLVPELRKELGLAENFAADYVLVSKTSLRFLEPPPPSHKDKLSDALCALLSIDAERKTRIESSLASAREQFSSWAKENVQRDGPEGESVVRYTLPAATDFADGLSNNLMTMVGGALGVQRADLFRTYADTWFQIQMGYLGAVTNTLMVLRKQKENGEWGFYYLLKREGSNSSMSEGPGEINPKSFPPAWRNVFVDGWAEVAEREGLKFSASAK